MTQYTIHQSFDQNFQNRQPIPLSSSTRHPIIPSVPISQLPRQPTVHSPESDKSMGYPNKDNVIHSPTRHDVLWKGTQSETLNPFRNQSFKNRLGKNSSGISRESRIGIVSRKAYQPEKQTYDHSLTYRIPEQPNNTPSPHASPFQQRPAVTPVTPKQPSNTPTPHTSLYKRRPDTDLSEGYSGHKIIRATSIDPLHGRSVTEPGEFGNHCKTVAVSSAQDLNGNKSLIETAEMEHQSVDQPNRWGTEDPHTTKQITDESQITTSTSTLNSTINKLDVEGKDFPLHHAAIYCKDKDKFKTILDENRDDVRKVDKNGKTPLELAYYSEFIPIDKIKMIVSKGFKDAKALFEIYKSAPSNLLEIIFDKNIHDRMNEADSEAINTLRGLLIAGGDITCKTKHKKTLLHIACLYSSLNSVKYLLDKGCNISVDETEEPLLFICCRSSLQPVPKMRHLKLRGTDLLTRHGHNKTLLHEACEHGTSHCVKYLLDEKVNAYGMPGGWEHSLLYSSFVTEIESLAKIKLLIDSDFNERYPFSYLLNKACMYSDIGVLEYLFDFARDRNLQLCFQGEAGKTPIYSCCVSNKQPVPKMKLLVSKGSRLDFTYDDGKTPLHVACKHGEYECIEYLLENGLDVNCKDKLGHKPLFYCQSRDEPNKMMGLLTRHGADFDLDEEVTVTEADAKIDHDDLT
ncbi:serine/threonine-protein phosphatase 6 regulatory ankyrin repeat subunit C-like [Patella vulgata]|uniref:serine/threonine-protein phosphatase 6 regulatory ankyrin repeat subunit C-like n=1 Tax=Patella vulgata TaxID=6465 RepID=UPI00217F5340|nr:serine/threonine-protein phosphatase 6 regulatory ankyrin repeat subunit C-like [Patella vulgata]